MVPASATAVVVFLLLVMPGVAVELRVHRVTPRRDESAFIEISRVLANGTGFSGAAAAVLVALSWAVPGTAADPVALIRDGGAYVEDNPALVLRTLAALPVLGTLFAIAAHDLTTAPTRRHIVPGSTWHVAFGMLAVPGVRTYLSVELTDGTALTGYAGGYSTESDPAKRDLLLHPPIAMRRPGETTAAELGAGWEALVVNGAQIATVAAAYVGAPKTGRPAWWRRPLPWLARHVWQSALAAAAAVLLALALTA